MIQSISILHVLLVCTVVSIGNTAEIIVVGDSWGTVGKSEFATMAQLHGLSVDNIAIGGMSKLSMCGGFICASIELTRALIEHSHDSLLCGTNVYRIYRSPMGTVRLLVNDFRSTEPKSQCPPHLAHDWCVLLIGSRD